MNVIGDVAGKHAIVIDDIIDTAGTRKLPKPYGKRREIGCCLLHTLCFPTRPPTACPIHR